MTKKKYLKTIEEVLALKDTDTKIYCKNSSGWYCQFIEGILCRIYSGSTPIFNTSVDVNGDYYILVEEPVKDADENDIGKLCKFWDSDESDNFISTLTRINSYYHSKENSYNHCRRLTPAEVAEMTGYRVEE